MPIPAISFPAVGNELSIFQQTVFTNTLLPAYLPAQRWFTSKGKKLVACHVLHAFKITENSFILIVSVRFGDGSQEVYQLPLAIIRTNEVAKFYKHSHANLILGSDPKDDNLLLADAVPLKAFRHSLFIAMQQKREDGDGLTFDSSSLLNTSDHAISSTVPTIDSSNTVIIFNDRYFFKLFRKLDPGLNPDLELTRFLSEETDFKYSPTYCGSFSVAETEEADFINLGLMIRKVDNKGDAWSYFQQLTERFYHNLIQQDLAETAPPRYEVTTSYDSLSVAIQKVLDQETYDRARLLGKRTGEMHRSLASASAANTALSTEAFTDSYREEIFGAAKNLLDRQFTELNYKAASLSPEIKAIADSVLLLRGLIEERLSSILKGVADLTVTRIHADYHLGQVLVTENDYCIIDFEGEPLLSIPERRRKRPPFKDLAGMVRSFHYAAMGQLLLNDAYSEEQRRRLSGWGEWWFRQVRSSFLNGYMSVTEGSSFVPENHSAREDLLDFFVLEKAIYETAYELNSRPDWLPIPLKGMLFALQDNQGK